MQENILGYHQNKNYVFIYQFKSKFNKKKAMPQVLSLGFPHAN